MHICIPDTREVKPQHGAAYLLYNIHIDGLYHCSLRYKQLLHLHHLITKKFNNIATLSNNPLSTTPYHLPQFPPKKLLPLSSGQIEERRMQLEKYLQYISQDKMISSSSIFNLFLLEAQRESTRIKEKHVHLDIELVNGQKIRLPILTHDSADEILRACCRALSLSDRYHAYFCLCLCGYDVVRDRLIIKRRLSFNEAPFITLQMAIQQQEQLQNVLSVGAANSSRLGADAKSKHIDRCQASCGTCCRSGSCKQQQPANDHTSVVPSFFSSPSSPTTEYIFADGNPRSCEINHSNNDNNNNNSQDDRVCSCEWNCQTSRQLAGDDGYRHQSQDRHHYHNRASLEKCRSFVTHRILLRKSYWDPIYDTYILNDQQALNLLFIQTVYDMKHSLMFVDRETYHQLDTLLAQDMKLDYILLARTLKYYNYVHFEPCYSDYPRPRTKVMISIGSKELNMRVLKQPPSSRVSSSNVDTDGSTRKSSSDEPILYCTSSLVPNSYQRLLTKDDIVEEEYNFKVPLIRCWRLTSLETLNSNTHNNRSDSPGSKLASGSNSNRGNSLASPVATTTLAGGKRRSLSLFNSIVGNSSPPASSNKLINNANAGSLSGSDGRSLLATLTSINNGCGSNTTTNGSTYNSQSSSAAIASAVTPQSQLTQRQRQQQQGNLIHNHNDPTKHNDISNGNSCIVPLNGCQQYLESHTCDCDARSQICKQHQQNCDETGGSDFQCCKHHHHNHHRSEQPMSQYELSFEYLISKDNLKWITISSDQAIFISISLQGVVDELVSKREGANYSQLQHQHQFYNRQIQQQYQLQHERSTQAHYQRRQPPAQLYFNPSPPRSDLTTTQLIPPLYPSGLNSFNQSSITTMVVSAPSNEIGSNKKKHNCAGDKEQIEDGFAYMRRDGSQTQLNNRGRAFMAVGEVNTNRADWSQASASSPIASRRTSRALTLIPSFWNASSSTSPQSNGQPHQQARHNEGSGGGASALFSASPSSSSSISSLASSSANTAGLRKLPSSASNGQANYQRDLMRTGQKQAPSPIINDAFEGASSSHDD